ncbi:MAG TPA: SDR family oxidoreductase [Polyangiaceae bacterium]|nr:SDR family oxidoreductase [Polyangiaceae bacterium]
MGVLSSETVLITGASSGIGEAAARQFAAGGARLVLVARRAERLEALAASLPSPCHVLALDVRDGPGVERALAALPAEFAEVSVLVNNAGGALGLEPAQRADWDDWQTMVDVNITALLRVTRALLPGMVARRRGHIINLGSVAGSYPYPGGNVYGAAKAFVAQFALNLRSDLAGTNVRVTNVEPGMVETEFSLVRFKGDGARAQAVYENMKPLGPDDIAEVLVWCATRPPHVNINRVELMPTQQSFGLFAVDRSGRPSE